MSDNPLIQIPTDTAAPVRVTVTGAALPSAGDVVTVSGQPYQCLTRVPVSDGTVTLALESVDGDVVYADATDAVIVARAHSDAPTAQRSAGVSGQHRYVNGAASGDVTRHEPVARRDYGTGNRVRLTADAMARGQVRSDARGVIADADRKLSDHDTLFARTGQRYLTRATKRQLVRDRFRARTVLANTTILTTCPFAYADARRASDIEAYGQELREHHKSAHNAAFVTPDDTPSVSV